MAFEKLEPGDEESLRRMQELFSPSQIDQSVRQALQMCWMMLPQDKRTVAEVETQFRRIVDRAIKDMHDAKDAGC